MEIKILADNSENKLREIFLAMVAVYRVYSQAILLYWYLVKHSDAVTSTVPASIQSGSLYTFLTAGV